MGLPGWVALLFSLFSNALTTYIHTIKFHIPGQSLDRPMSAKNTAQDSTLPIFCFFALDNRPPIFYPFFDPPGDIFDKKRGYWCVLAGKIGSNVPLALLIDP